MVCKDIRKSFFNWTLLCCLLLTSNHAYSLSAEISGTQFALRSDLPKEDTQALFDFTTEHIEFLRGRFFSNHTYMSFKADTASISELTQLLSVKAQLTVHVYFKAFDDPDVSFSIHQWNDRELELFINREYKDIDWNELTLQVSLPVAADSVSLKKNCFYTKVQNVLKPMSLEKSIEIAPICCDPKDDRFCAMQPPNQVGK